MLASTGATARWRGPEGTDGDDRGNA